MSASAPRERPERPSDAPVAPGTGSVAWCESCERLVTVDPLRDRDAPLYCPDCGAELIPTGDEDDDAPPKAPWHFKVLLVGTVGYLIYRVIWFIGWLRHHG